MNQKIVSAQWDTKVKLLTIISSGILGHFIIDSAHHFGQLHWSFRTVAPVAVIVFALTFMVTGYGVDSKGIVIRRLFWTRHISRDQVNDVSFRSSLGYQGIGLCGVWGFFGHWGLAYSKGIGLHLVIASSSAPKVLISRKSRLPILITPSDPERFIEMWSEAGIDVFA
jgi:hypothetical protein